MTTRPAVSTLFVDRYRHRFVRLLKTPVLTARLSSGKLLDQKDKNFGFNAFSDKYEDMVKSGVIDPTKVVRAALQDAASVAGLLITTEAAGLPTHQKTMLAAAAPAMPDMGGMGGGMGGMGF